ncbi:MAG TPA: glycan-binding surface protein, partial [Ohtaekwangia sp.]|uniref:glycan-binding surface protein n=1 Tax=Ohtaekwangia sp. TaxID=2066019 RepID=UPI002F91C033
SKGGTSSYEIIVTGAPIIAHIRNYTGSQDDAVVDAIFPGQQINIVGYNLKGATKIAFQGIDADLSSVVYTDSSAIVQVPSDFSTVDVTLANTVNYTTPIGTVAFHIGIVGPPLITNVSCENPSVGSTVYIKGYNFVSVDSLKFGGTLISDFEASPDGNTIKFVVPNLTKSGPVVIVTPGGRFNTIFNVNDYSTGTLCNFDDISPIGWNGYGATVSDNGTDFPGSKGKYAILKNEIVSPWDWQAWSGGRIIILDPVKWMSKDEPDSLLDSWAVKFELNVPAAWNGNSLFVSSEHNDFKITYEPWKDATGKTFGFKTAGWQTITLPLSLFRKSWGGTVPPTNLKDLLGNRESCGFAIQTMNISNSNSVTGLMAAVDNIRVVKIK